MRYKPRFTSKKREALYQCEALAAYKAGLGKFPICVHCHQPVTGKGWDESHVGAPAALGGTQVGVGHRICNQLDNNLNVTPMVARVKRVRLRHLGITGPGLGRHPLPGGVRSAVSKTMRHGVQPRSSLGERLTALRARRWFDQNAPQQE